MLFNSLQFVFFFIVVYSTYLMLRRRGQNRLLLVASYIFYGVWDWRFLGLLLLSTLVDWFVALELERADKDEGARKRVLWVSICVNLGILGFFKYFNFFGESFADLASTFGVQISPFTLEIILPVGISFYTFQSMSYTIDVYRRELKACHSLFDFALYVSFFPQLVAGPIERARTLLPQVLSDRRITADGIRSGLYLILLGFFKKVVIADNLAASVDQIFSKSGGFGGGEAAIGVLFFAMQIYCDFSGYTDIARGLSRLMGFDLMENFNLPYFARNPSDFWRRWHISLSTWLRDYLYVPLGGNRRGRLLTYRNLFLTMLLGGLWHGAAWNFVLWGVYHGLMLIGHRAYVEFVSPRLRLARFVPAPVATIASVAVMLAFTLYGWLLFRAGSFEQIANMTGSLLQFAGGLEYVANGLAKLAFFAGPLFLLEALQHRSQDAFVLTRARVPVQAMAFAGLFCAILVLGNYDGESFIYFQF